MMLQEIALILLSNHNDSLALAFDSHICDSRYYVIYE